MKTKIIKRITLDFESEKAARLFGQYFGNLTTDGGAARAWKELTGKDMLEDEDGFEFMSGCSQMFSKMYELSKI